MKKQLHTADKEQPSPTRTAAPASSSSRAAAIDETFEIRRADELSALLAAIVESSDDAIISCTLSGRINSWNKAAERIYGYKTDEMLGQPTSVLGSPSAADDTEDVLKRIGHGERIDHYQTIRRHKDGSDIIVSLTVSPIRNSAGEVIGISKVSRDITQTRRSEEALRNADKLALAGRMSASIAHEINNPLESVTNLIYLLKQDQSLSPQSRQYLDLADSELARVTHITSQTLGFFRGGPSRSFCEVPQLLESALSLHTGRFLVNGIKVKTRYRQVSPLFCYQGELRQVFVNLVANAIDAMSGNGELSVRVRPASDTITKTSGIRITIADNGIGMSEKTLNHLFEPFYTTKGATGTGLGLWVTQQIVARHKGRISIRSAQRPSRHGTVFSIFFPHSEENAAEGTVAKPKSKPTRARKNKTVTSPVDESRRTPSQFDLPSTGYNAA